MWPRHRKRERWRWSTGSHRCRASRPGPSALVCSERSTRPSPTWPSADPAPPGGRGRLLAPTFDPLAERWVDRGCAILARGRVVVTDRLHGHLLALLQDIPHVVLDNSYGKLRSVYDTWTHASPVAHWAESPDEALTTARGLV
jgi:hypothetical protein